MVARWHPFHFSVWSRPVSAPHWRAGGGCHWPGLFIATGHPAAAKGLIGGRLVTAGHCWSPVVTQRQCWAGPGLWLYLLMVKINCIKPLNWTLPSLIMQYRNMLLAVLRTTGHWTVELQSFIIKENPCYWLKAPSSTSAFKNLLFKTLNAKRALINSNNIGF